MPHICIIVNIVINYEVEKLLKKGVIVRAPQDEKGYFSNIFICPKKDGPHRMILNLKKLNTSMEAPHFKMESIKNITSMMHKNVWMASEDLKGAYFTIPIHPDHQALLRFLWYDTYQFTAMPNRYADAMRVFTKILKPSFALLRKFGHLSMGYVDDPYLQGENFLECLHNLEDTVALLQALGFTIDPDKSQLIPTQKMTFLGFVIDSMEMTLKLTENKQNKIFTLREEVIKSKVQSIKKTASLLGNITTSFETVPWGPQYCRNVEHCKIEALKTAKGNFECRMSLSPAAKIEVAWWRDNINTSYRN